MHYEINTPFTEANNKWVNFDPVTGQQLIAGQNGVSRTGNINTDYNALEPRISFAYQLEQKDGDPQRLRRVLLPARQRRDQYPPVPAAAVRLRRQPCRSPATTFPSTMASMGFPIVTTSPEPDQGSGAVCL